VCTSVSIRLLISRAFYANASATKQKNSEIVSESPQLHRLNQLDSLARSRPAYEAAAIWSGLLLKLGPSLIGQIHGKSDVDGSERFKHDSGVVAHSHDVDTQIEPPLR